MSESLYTAFYFREKSGVPPIPNLHCTHKYLGKHTATLEREVAKIADLFFKWRPPEIKDGYSWCFDKLAIFGEAEKALVLIGHLKDPCEMLRETLGEFRKDDFPEYNMHVTLAYDLATVAPMKTPIDVPLWLEPMEYRLMRGREKLRVWKLGT